MIPFCGSGKQAINNFECGDWGWGRKIPGWVKNQMPNLIPMPSYSYHRALHGLGEMSGLERAWFGTPNWVKAGAASAAGRAITAGKGGSGCGCD